MDTLTKDSVLSTLQDFLAEILGEDVMTFLNISMDSRFVQDLEMDSIQIVSFSEKVKMVYQLDAQFTAWLSKQSMKKIINLTVGDVVKFIVENSKK